MKRVPFIISALAVALVIVPSAVAKGKKSKPSPEAPPATPANNQDTTPPPVPDNSPTTKPVNEIAQANAALAAATKKATDAYESTPEWKTAADNATSARADYETTRAGAIAALKSNPDYQAAVAASDKAEKDVDEVRGRSVASPDELMNAANKAIAARGLVTQMESGNGSKDPAMVAAKAKVTAANAAMIKLRKAEQAAVEADPAVTAAKQALDDAKSKAGKST